MKPMTLVLLLILMCCTVYGNAQSYCTPAQAAIVQQQWHETFGSDLACVQELARQVYDRSAFLRGYIVPKTS